MSSTFTEFQVKYAPRNLNEVIYPSEQVESQIKGIASGHLNTNLLLYGPPRTSKSTTAKLLAAELWGNQNNKFTHIVPEDYDRGKNLPSFIESSMRLALIERYVVVMDELDLYSKPKLLTQMWDALKDKQVQVSWIATTNNMNKLDPALRQRFAAVDWSFNSIDLFIPRIMQIMSMELPAAQLPDEQTVRASYQAMFCGDPTVNWQRILSGAEQLVAYLSGKIPKLFCV